MELATQSVEISKHSHKLSSKIEGEFCDRIDPRIAHDWKLVDGIGCGSQYFTV